MKYRKDAGAPKGQFYLNDKPLKHDEVAKQYNKLKAAHEYKMAQLSQKYEAIVEEHEELTTDHLILKTELALKDKQINSLLAKA